MNVDIPSYPWLERHMKMSVVPNLSQTNLNRKGQQIFVTKKKDSPDCIRCFQIDS